MSSDDFVTFVYSGKRGNRLNFIEIEKKINIPCIYVFMYSSCGLM